MAATVSTTPATISGASQFELRSEATGRDYRISVYTPFIPPPADGYPALYVVDAQLTFPIAAAMASAFAREGRAALVVGISYPTDDVFELIGLRKLDLTPPVPRDESPAAQTEEHGGYQSFLSFLVDELRPVITGQTPLDRHRKALFGHSLGGLFVACALATHPECFDTFMASSPTLYWGDRWVFNQLTAGNRFSDLDVLPRVLITVGALEQELPATMAPSVTAEAMRAMLDEWRMVDYAGQLAELLRASPGAERMHVQFHAFKGEDHLTVLAPAISRGLAFFLRPQVTG